jgi:hypothetical protein
LGQHDFHEVPVLIKHQTNVTALTGEYPRAGEIVVVHFSEDGSINLVGKIRTD